PCPDGSNDIWLADVDGDGFLDVVHAAKTSNTITWYKNPCTSTPCTPTGTWTATTIDGAATGVSSLAVADLDLDGKSDIVANSSTAANSVVWYRNNGGSPVTWTKTQLTTTTAAIGVFAANLHSNGDRAPDIVASAASAAGAVDWWPNTTLHSNIRFQVRTWGTDCSNPTGAFVGPDGTSGSYYTETTETLRVTNNQCFQYKAYFFTNDAAKNPNLQSVTINYDRTYATDSPSIEPNTGVSYSRLTDFVETLGPGHAGGTGSQVKYQLCKVGDPQCYFYNGSAWANASPTHPAQRNDAATVKASIGRFDDDQGYATGFQSATFYFKAFLISDGIKQVELDTVAVQPDLLSATLTRPVGGEAWQASQTETLTWNYSCVGSPCNNLKLEYSKEGDFTDAVTIIASAANGANGTCSTPPPGSTGCYPWTIPDAIATTVKVRVTDTTNAALTDTSDTAFTIAGTVTVTAPN